jgi:hypothetical protein
MMEIESSSSEYDLREAAHPITCILTSVFKFGPIISYLFLETFGKNPVFVYVITVILIAIDFWFMKNISGR